MNKNYFGMHRVALKIFGASVYPNESKLYETFSFCNLIFVCSYPFVFIADLVGKEYDVVVEMLQYEMLVLLAVAKMVTIRNQRFRVGKLFDKLEMEPFAESVQHDDRERNLIRECTKIVRIQSLAYWITTGIFYSADVGYTLIKRLASSDYHNWAYPFGTFTILGSDRSPNYELSWFYQSYACGWIGSLFSTIDATLAALLVHICYQLRILQNRLKRIVATARENQLKNSIKNDLGEVEYSTDVDWEYLQPSIKSAVQYHLAIIDIAQEINNCFGVSLLVVFLGTLGILSVMVLRASMLSSDDPHLITTLGDILIVILQLVLICFWSEEVTHESRKVGLAAFGSDFVGSDLQFQKCLLVIHRNAQVPITLQAGNFVAVGLETLTRILRASYSAFMVLRNYHQSDN